MKPTEKSKLLDKDRDDYIRDMEEYLEYLKSLPIEEARKLARKSLYNAGILDLDGNFTEHYRDK